MLVLEWFYGRLGDLQKSVFEFLSLKMLSYYDSKVTKFQVSSFIQYHIFKYRPYGSRATDIFIWLCRFLQNPQK